MHRRVYVSYLLMKLFRNKSVFLKFNNPIPLLFVYIVPTGGFSFRVVSTIKISNSLLQDFKILSDLKAYLLAVYKLHSFFLKSDK